MINPAIFRSYDIRGSSLNDITPDNAYKIAVSFAKLNITEKNNLICIGRDGRISSPALYKAFVDGLIYAGAEVISIGIVATPMLYFAEKKFKPAASVMITGSHNPKDDNGFKMIAGGKSFFGDQIQELLETIQNSSNLYLNQNSPIEVKTYDIYNEYVSRILEMSFIKSDLKIAWDLGNGAAGTIMQLLKDRLPNINIIINGEVDGNFPNHHPDPTVLENLAQLIATVKSENCDFGIAFDGDADRIAIVSSTGRVIFGDQLLCIFAKDILLDNPSATIIADVKTSQVVFDQIASYGGNPLMWKTGHSLIKTKMFETGALLAGEMSGHIFFADKYYGYDDAIYASIRFIDIVSRSKCSLDEMLAELPIVYNTPEIRIKTSDESKFKIIQGIKKHLQDSKIDFNDIDGLRVNTINGWWLLRASNTEPAIIARCESKTETGLELLKTEIDKLLKLASI